jgi:hypothetical protein
VTVKSPGLPIRNSRFGFHYFEDDTHFREHDLTIWLPILKTLGTSWLLLRCPFNRAIPESFITGLVEAGIEPILQLPAAMDGLPAPLELEPIISAYQRWGCHLIIFYDQPNSRQAWKSTGWTQDDLVERFLDHYLPYASLALQNGLIPVFPPLLPGGDYWDTAFLRTALEAMERRKQNQLLDNLVLSAYAWTHGHTLDWGAGGPERWPDARPYFTPSDTQDHLGIRIADWYQAIANAVLQHTPPTILLQLGRQPDSLSIPESIAKTSLTCGRMLNGEESSGFEPFPTSILAGMFWPLSTTQGTGWFSTDGSPQGFIAEWQSWVQNINQQSATGKNFSPASTTDHPLGHYLLLPHPDAGLFDWQWEAIRPFVRKYSPTVGFSVLEATLAVHITVLGSEEEFPEEILNQLRANGSWVERISGNGTDVATSLAER